MLHGTQQLVRSRQVHSHLGAMEHVIGHIWKKNKKKNTNQKKNKKNNNNNNKTGRKVVLLITVGHIL